MSTAPQSLWRHGDFAKLWTAQTISLFGSQVTQLALPLTAVIVLHASALEVGLLGVAQYAPWLVLGLPAGVWVDRLPRRAVLIAADLVRAAVLLAIPAAYALGALRLEMLYPIAFVAGAMTVFFDVADQSYLPSLVGRDQLMDGNAKLQVSQSAAQLVGPGLGGLLVQLLRAPAAILVDAVSYLGSAACLLLIRKREEPAAAGRRRPGLADVGEGLRFVLGHPLLRPIAVTTAISNFAVGGMLQSIFLLYANRTLGMAPAAIGIVYVATNAGGLAGAFFSRRLSQRIGLGPTMIAASALARVGALLLPLATPDQALVVLPAGLLLAGLGTIVYNVSNVTVRQAATPDEMLGRMNATVRFLTWGAIPAGALVWGLVGGAIDLRAAVLLAVLINAGATVVLVLSPIRGLREAPAPGVGSAKA